MRILQEKAAPTVAVVDAAGRLVGLITRGTVGEMLMGIGRRMTQETELSAPL